MMKAKTEVYEALHFLGWILVILYFFCDEQKAGTLCLQTSILDDVQTKEYGTATSKQWLTTADPKNALSGCHLERGRKGDRALDEWDQW